MVFVNQLSVRLFRKTIANGSAGIGVKKNGSLFSKELATDEKAEL